MNRLIISDISNPIVKDYLKDIGRYKVLTKDEELSLLEQYKQGDESAYQTLVTSNLRFVIRLAKKYQGKNTPILDLISAGNLGLMRAIKTYDPSKSPRLVNYAAWWIKLYITEFINHNGRTIRQPVSFIVHGLSINKFIDEYKSKYNKDPSLEEISKATKLPITTIEKNLNTNQQVLSIDNNVDDEIGSFEGIIPDENSVTPDEYTDNIIVHNMIYNALNKLSDRDHDVICMNFGIGCKRMTLTDISKKFGCSIERIRQIRNKALELLKEENDLSSI